MGRACAINCTTGAALTFLGLCLVPQTAFAASSGDTHDTVEKTIPQGKDPPLPSSYCGFEGGAGAYDWVRGYGAGAYGPGA
jgi:hypothetical protein